MTEIAAILLTLILIGLGIFQTLLILGFPIGKLAWGGYHKVLPTSLRIASVISILIYTLIALVALDKAEIISFFTNDSVVNTGIWVVTVYFGLGIFVNGISRSKPERIVMTPLTLVLFLLSLMVAINL